MIKKDYINQQGIQRRVWLLNTLDDPEQGMPADVFDDLDELYQDASQAFRDKLYSRLWQLNLIEPQDFQKSSAIKRYRQALQFAIKHDATDAIRHIKKLELETS